MNKLNLLILLWEKLLKNKRKQLKIKEKKQIDADLKLKEIKPRETKPNEYSDYFLNELPRIRKSFESVNFYDLTYNFKDSNILLVSFIEFKGPNTIFKNIHNGNIPLEDVEKEQKQLKAELGRINQENSKNKSPEKTKTINNIKNLYT